MTATTYAYNSDSSIAATATIANGDSLSDAIETASRVALALVLPAVMTGTVLSFAAAIDDVTFQPVFDSTGAEVQVTVGASRYVLLPKLFPAKAFKIRSGPSSAPTPEAADRVITVLLRPMAG